MEIIAILLILYAAKVGGGKAIDALQRQWQASHAGHVKRIKTDRPGISDGHARRMAAGRTLAHAVRFLPEAGREARRGFTEARHEGKEHKADHQEWKRGHKERLAAEKQKQREKAERERAEREKAAPEPPDPPDAADPNPPDAADPNPPDAADPNAADPDPPDDLPNVHDCTRCGAKTANPHPDNLCAYCAHDPENQPVNGSNSSPPDPGGNPAADNPGNAGNGGNTMGAPTGEATTYDATNAQLDGFGEIANNTLNAADQMVASIQGSGVKDQETIGNITEIATRPANS